MSEIDPAFEQRILRDLVEQMRDVDKTMRSRTRMRRALIGTGLASMLVALFLTLFDRVHPFPLVCLAGLSGCAIGFGIFLDFAHKQWPITRRHIDMDSVHRRLEELADREE